MTIKISKNIFLEIKNSHKLKENNKLETSLKNLLDHKKKWRDKILPTKKLFNKNKNNEKENEIKSLLNKISVKNFDKISKKILEISNDEKTIYFLINYIFTISTIQPTFCAEYVKLIKLFINTNNKVSIYEFLNRKCLDYEKSEYFNIKNNKNLSYDEFCNNNKKKKFITGFSQFLGELYLKNIINYITIFEILVKQINKLCDFINQNDLDNEIIEAFILCISSLFNTIYNNINIKDKNLLIDKLVVILQKDKLCKRLKFKLMDIKDKRNII